MNWMTKGHVKQEAVKGEIPALKCSLEHHKQGRDADYVELVEAIENEDYRIDGPLCAACNKFSISAFVGCQDCPLKGSGNSSSLCCKGLWVEASLLHKEICTGDHSNATLKAFQDAEAEICKFIEGVIAEAKLKEADEPEFGHCDYGIYKSTGCIWIVMRRNKKLELFGGRGGGGETNNLDLPDMLKLGNLNDDIKRNSEDLTKFEIGCCRAETDEFGALWIRQGEDRICINEKYKEEFHQKLGQILATLQRKAK